MMRAEGRNFTTSAFKLFWQSSITSLTVQLSCVFPSLMNGQVGQSRLCSSLWTEKNACKRKKIMKIKGHYSNNFNFLLRIIIRLPIFKLFKTNKTADKIRLTLIATPVESSLSHLFPMRLANI